MAVEVIVPEVGEAGMEVVFVGWLHADGEVVEEGAELFEVDTSKTEIAVEALSSGILRHGPVAPGDPVEIRQVVGWITREGEEPPHLPTGSVAAATPAATAGDRNSLASAQSDSTARSAPGSRVSADRSEGRTGSSSGPVSPRARRLADQLGVEVGLVSGSGPEGLVTEADVELASTALESPAAARNELTEQKPRAALDPARERVRRGTASLTARSWEQIPHFHLAVELDVTRHRRDWRPTSLVLALVTAALADRPELNRRWHDGQLVRSPTIDAGLLVDTSRGLLLPRLADLEPGLEEADLSALIAAAVSRARQGVMRSDDHGQRSFTLSNLGMHAVDRFFGVIPTPDVLLVSCGRIRTLPRWDGGEWVPRDVIDVAVSMDHRAFDGADGARLLDVMEARLSQAVLW